MCDNRDESLRANTIQLLRGIRRQSASRKLHQAGPRAAKSEPCIRQLERVRIKHDLEAMVQHEVRRRVDPESFEQAFMCLEWRRQRTRRVQMWRADDAPDSFLAHPVHDQYRVVGV